MPETYNIVPIFLPWEINLQLTYLQKNILTLLPNLSEVIPLYKAIVEFQFPVTVDHLRASLGFPPHPDNVRGSSYAYMPAPPPQASDFIIPAAQIIQAWNEIEYANSRSATPLTEQQLEAQYPLLYAAYQEAQ